jgi:hypothetical protein
MKLLQGDCLERLHELAPNSVDSLITDPPAGISFMGKEWDKDKGGRKQWVAWMTEVMTECMRVMKPGAHGLVWAIPRTSHWTATALEDAGFEVRDVVTHLFGSGFPKSLDISKAIDKAAGVEPVTIGRKMGASNAAGLKHDGRTQSGGAYLQTGKYIADTAPASESAAQWNGWGTALKPSNERWILCRKPILSEKLLGKTATSSAPEWEEIFLSTEMLWKNIWDAVSSPQNTSIIKTIKDLTIALKTLSCSIFGLTQVITTLDEIRISGELFDVSTVEIALKNASQTLSDLRTIIARENVLSIADILRTLIELQQRDDDALNLAPFAEDYILIRKPCSEKTVAANVLKWGVGGINIDGCRVSTSEIKDATHHGGKFGMWNANGDNKGYIRHNGNGTSNTQGRFPANLVLSHTIFCDDNACDEECPVKMLDGQAKTSTTGKRTKNIDYKSDGMFPLGSKANEYTDKGGASRFFYTAKASKRERGEGNVHPTVKPLKLMKYLITLITPPRGVVLDPFMGSGSTGVAAKELGMQFVGIEKEEQYIEIAEKRIEATT